MADYFKQQLKNETSYLKGQISKFEKYLNDSSPSEAGTDQPDASVSGEVIPDFAIDNIRLAIGQSHLFINERFKQFHGLIDDSEAKRGEKEIKVEDLAGFWDMIYYQVEDLKVKWASIEKLEADKWIDNQVKEDDQKSEAVPVKSKPLADKNNIYKNRKSLPKTTTNGTANGAANGKPKAVRSNFREFLKTKHVEVKPTSDSSDVAIDIKLPKKLDSSNHESVAIAAVDKEN